jgi:hypothetical protein
MIWFPAWEDFSLLPIKVWYPAWTDFSLLLESWFDFQHEQITNFYKLSSTTPGQDHLASYSVRNEDPSSGVKWPERGTHHSQCSTKVKNVQGWRPTSTTPYAFTWCTGTNLHMTDIFNTFYEIQGDQKVSVHLMIAIQKVTSLSCLTTRLNLTAWQPTARARRILDSH